MYIFQIIRIFTRFLEIQLNEPPIKQTELPLYTSWIDLLPEDTRAITEDWTFATRSLLKFNSKYSVAELLTLKSTHSSHFRYC